MRKMLPCRIRQSFLPFNMQTFNMFNMLSVLTRDFLGIYITSLFSVYNFRTISPRRGIFFWKYFKFYVDPWNSAKNWENFFLFGNSCISLGCVKHLLLLRENTFHRVSISWKTVSTFQILLKHKFLSWFSLGEIKNFVKNTAVQI